MYKERVENSGGDISDTDARTEPHTLSTYASFSSLGMLRSCRSIAENSRASRMVAVPSCKSICSQKPVDRWNSGPS